MVGGFAFAAYSAEYRSSGIMTLIVNESAVVYEKDLGSDEVGKCHDRLQSGRDLASSRLRDEPRAARIGCTIWNIAKK